MHELWGYERLFLTVERLASIIGPALHGAGYAITTDPLTAPLLAVISPEVTIRVEPDGYDFTDRYDVPTWAGLVVGFDLPTSRQLAKRWASGKGKPKTGRFVSCWDEYESLVLKWTTPQVAARVVEQHPVVVMDEAAGLNLLDLLDEPTALDYEWDERTLEPLGLAIATADRTWYVPTTDMRVRDVVRRNILRGLPTIWHGARADLGTQWPGDPLEAFGAPIDDTMIEAYLVDERDLHLKYLARTLLGRQPMAYPGDLRRLPLPTVARYAGADARNTFDLHLHLLGRLAATGQLSVYYDIERPLVPVIASMERYGSRIDAEATLHLHTNVHHAERGLRADLWRRYRLDVDDPLQARRIVEVAAGMDPGTVDKRVLTMIPHPAVDAVIGYRNLLTLRRNFLDKHIGRWVEAGAPNDYRVYPRFNQAGSMDEGKRAPRTGRLSSADPNLQNQPRFIRDIFVPPPGATWVSGDYSGLELHIAAALSGDPTMLGALNSGQDLHGLFKARIEQIGGRAIERIVAKSGNFEQLYGGGAKKLMEIVARERIFIDIDTAKAIVSGHEQTFPRYHQWAKDKVVEARAKGYAETLFGRRRYLPELYWGDEERRGNAERAAVNTPIQGTAADVAKIAMARLVPILRHYGAHLNLQVHDELDAWVYDRAEQFKDGMVEVMESVEIPGLRLKVEAGVGSTWGGAH